VMSKGIISLLIALLLAAAQASAQTPSIPQTRNERVSYGLGVAMARNVKAQKIEIAPEILVKALRDEFSGQKPVLADTEVRRLVATFSDVSKSIASRGVGLKLDLMILGFEDMLLERKLRVPIQEINRTLIMFQVELQRERNRDLKNLMEDNRRKGEVFLAENSHKEGVVTLPSGLQYKILQAGKGRAATETDTVECRYRGTHLSGLEFESSYRKGRPESFKVTRVILGWKEALKLMSVGSKWQLFIPSHLAYGVVGRGNDIGPNETLIYELELLVIR